MSHSEDLSRHAGRLARFLIVGLLAGALLSTPLFPHESDSVPSSQFTAATYNVKNLFDEYDDPYANDEETVPKTKPREELEALARVIRAMNADVLALQEVESRGVLRKLKNGFLKGMEYNDPVLFEGNDMRGIDVAVLSRLPVGPVTSYRHLTFGKEDGQSTRFSRDLLRARVQPTGGFWFDLYAVHLKSGSGAGDRKKREAEARQVREILEEELGREPGYRFIIIGDFNDARESLTVKIIEGEGAEKLFCPSDFLPEEERYTFFHKGKKARFDYIFCSPSMKDLYVAGSVRVISGEDAALASDHRPLVASFEIPAGK